MRTKSSATKTPRHAAVDDKPAASIPKSLFRMQINLDAFTRATADLTDAEFRAVFTVCARAWRSIEKQWPQGCIPDDDDRLARIIGGAKPKRLISAVRELFQPSANHPGYLEWPPLSDTLEIAVRGYESSVRRADAANAARAAAAAHRREKDKAAMAAAASKVDELQEAVQFHEQLYAARGREMSNVARNETSNDTLDDTLNETSNDALDVTLNVRNQNEIPSGDFPRALKSSGGKSPHGGRESLPTSLHSPSAPPALSVAARGALGEQTVANWRDMLSTSGSSADPMPSPAAADSPEVHNRSVTRRPEAGTIEADEQLDTIDRKLMAAFANKKRVFELAPRT